MTIVVRVQKDRFDSAAEVASVTDDRDIGAVVTFFGLCRGESETLAGLEIEHYATMANAELRRIAEAAAQRFGLHAVTVIHRYGYIPVGDGIVLVVAASQHRTAAFEGANFIMDFLKTSAPFWKREHLVDGSKSNWVASKSSDELKRDGWL